MPMRRRGCCASADASADRAASADFDEQEMLELLMAISAINVWNRLAVSMHQPLS